ncbi:MAG: DnaJ domain-containing protein [candidate division WOR-3 bacterium]
MTLNQALKIFKLKENYTLEEVQKRFKKLCLKYHPDKTKDNEKFIKILEAREILIKNLQTRDIIFLFDAVIQKLNLYKEQLQKLQNYLTFKDLYYILLTLLKK